MSAAAVLTRPRARTWDDLQRDLALEEVTIEIRVLEHTSTRTWCKASTSRTHWHRLVLQVQEYSAAGGHCRITRAIVGGEEVTVQR